MSLLGVERCLPALINEVSGHGADDEDTQASSEDVVDGTEMLHLHQLTGGMGRRRQCGTILKVECTN